MSKDDEWRRMPAKKQSASATKLLDLVDRVMFERRIVDTTDTRGFLINANNIRKQILFRFKKNKKKFF